MCGIQHAACFYSEKTEMEETLGTCKVLQFFVQLAPLHLLV